MAISNNLLPHNFRDFIIQLNKYNVEYMIIGGFAMGSYGHFRGTNDLDIFINATEENAERMLKAPLRIEVLKKLDAVDFEYAYERVVKKRIDGIDMNVVDLDDLILLKKAAKQNRNKPRDTEDLTFLEKLKSKFKGK